MKNGKVRVGFDFDDTLFPLLGGWIRAMGKACDPALDLSEKDWTSFTLDERCPLAGKKLRAGIPLASGRVSTGQERFEMGKNSSTVPGWEKVTVYDFLSPKIYDGAKPYSEAPAAVAAIAKIPGVEVLCVTAHPRSVSSDPRDPERLAYEQAKKELIEGYFPQLKGKIVFESDKRKLDLDVLIDDGPHNIEAVTAAGTKGILVGRPWTRGMNVASAPRIATLDQAVSLVEQEARARIAEERKVAFRDVQRFPQVTAGDDSRTVRAAQAIVAECGK